MSTDALSESPVEDLRPQHPTTSPSKRKWRHMGAELALPAVLIISFIAFSLARPETFPTVGNVRGILLTQSVLAILALGAMFPLIVGDFDLSIAGNLGLGTVLVTGLSSRNDVPLWMATLIALIACGLVGLVNGLLVYRLNLNAFISTLAMGLILAGATDWYTGSQVIYENIPKALPDFGKGQLWGIPYPVILVGLLTIAIWFVLEQTPVGRYLYAVGGSKEAARLAGINVTRLGIGAFITCGVLAGCAGVLEAAVIGTGNSSIGSWFLLPAFAACFLGATTIRVGSFNAFGTIIAVITIAVGVAGLNLVGIPFYIEPIFNGAILIIAVLATRFLRREAV